MLYDLNKYLSFENFHYFDRLISEINQFSSVNKNSLGMFKSTLIYLYLHISHVIERVVDDGLLGLFQWFRSSYIKIIDITHNTYLFIIVAIVLIGFSATLVKVRIFNVQTRITPKETQSLCKRLLKNRYRIWDFL